MEIKKESDYFAVQVKIFCEDSKNKLENEINNFLIHFDSFRLLEIKYSFSCTNHQNFYSAVIIYKYYGVDIDNL